MFMRVYAMGNPDSESPGTSERPHPRETPCQSKTLRLPWYPARIIAVTQDTSTTSCRSPKSSDAQDPTWMGKSLHIIVCIEKSNPDYFEYSVQPVVHTCNPIYSGGRDQEDCSSKPSWVNSSPDPILKKINHKNGLTKRTMLEVSQNPTSNYITKQ
jgi:hypothetical protein